MVRVKICGFTTAQDVRAGMTAGCDAFGFNFAKGPRKISPALGKQLVGVLGPFHTAVGLFVDEDPARVRQICRDTGCHIAQLHGSEDPDQVRWLARWLPVIKAVRVRSAADVAALPPDLPLHGVLVDAFVPGVEGGTGHSWDYRLVADLALPWPLILAGGLQPQTVAAALQQLQPYAVDTASGVEAVPGRKDAAKMRAFVHAVRSAPAPSA